MGRDFQRKGPGMFKSQQYRAKAAEYGELIKRSIGPAEIRKFQENCRTDLPRSPDNEQGLADDYDNAVHFAEQDGSSGAALAAEEELVLRCLGAATHAIERSCRRRCGGDLRHRRVGRQVAGDGGAPRANRPISA